PIRRAYACSTTSSRRSSSRAPPASWGSCASVTAGTAASRIDATRGRVRARREFAYDDRRSPPQRSLSLRQRQALQGLPRRARKRRSRCTRRRGSGGGEGGGKGTMGRRTGGAGRRKRAASGGARSGRQRSLDDRG